MKELLRLESVAKHYHSQQVLHDINLNLYKGEFISILGSSGCGKTTLLKLIAGFETPDTGYIYLHDSCINTVAAQARNIHTVFQNYALFPHLSVFENVAFALRAKGETELNIHQKVNQALQLVKLANFGERYPEQLSGGQQQRVAIARAIINEPDILLLDESLSALDSHLRKQMQIELKQLQRKLGITFIYVTHSQSEALSMSDRIIVLNEGYIQQIGSPRDIYEEPQNLFVATFIGEANVFDFSIIESNAETLTINIEGKALSFANPQAFKANDKIHFIVRPEDLRVWHQSEVQDTTEMLSATVEEIIYKGSTVDLLVKLPSGKMLAASEFFDEDDEDLFYNIGDQVWIHWLRGWEVILPYEK